MDVVYHTKLLIHTYSIDHKRSALDEYLTCVGYRLYLVAPVDIGRDRWALS
jgi:uncharacterized membrane protein YkvA (DUF1232 family)